jgi:predicted enzyme related to lactoylglutathione lyase
MTTKWGTLRQVSQRAVDIDRACAFYELTLGLPLIARFGPLAFFDLDGVRLFLSTGEGVDSGPGSVLYLAVDDILAARATLAAKAVEFVDEPHVVFVDEAGTFGAAGEAEWMTFFRDSEGNVLALSSRESSHAAPQG